MRYKEGLGIREKLAMRDPANTDWKIDLVISLSRVAMVLEQQGEPQKREAGPNYQRERRGLWSDPDPIEPSFYRRTNKPTS